MVWKPELSEFVLNRLVQLVRRGVFFNMGFKEQHMKKAAADVLAFAGVHVTALQLYNHIRNWRMKWSVIMKMKSDRILDSSKDGCCFYGDDEETADEYIQLRIVPCGLQRYPKHRQYVGTPITNYAQIKTIFTPRFVCKTQLLQPNLLVRAIDFIADNEAEYAEYRKLQPPERRSWLRTRLRNQFPVLGNPTTLSEGVTTTLSYLQPNGLWAARAITTLAVKVTRKLSVVLGCTLHYTEYPHAEPQG
ncbi:hypothetical protein QYE76_023854 [Lolium multiflorum]|uniref:Myb/SANT-like domain-containing protein n=1 Tax=Lolium multiflorum TaxID=4521 RepID=A0AAD8RCA0_LOLMU|nr:hypothetical protein QYE76_023854 [Lolium multiflorum]